MLVALLTAVFAADSTAFPTLATASVRLLSFISCHFHVGTFPAVGDGLPVILAIISITTLIIVSTNDVDSCAASGGVVTASVVAGAAVGVDGVVVVSAAFGASVAALASTLPVINGSAIVS